MAFFVTLCKSRAYSSGRKLCVAATRGRCQTLCSDESKLFACPIQSVPIPNFLCERKSIVLSHMRTYICFRMYTLQTLRFKWLNRGNSKKLTRNYLVNWVISIDATNSSRVRELAATRLSVTCKICTSDLNIRIRTIFTSYFVILKVLQ